MLKDSYFMFRNIVCTISTWRILENIPPLYGKKFSGGFIDNQVFEVIQYPENIPFRSQWDILSRPDFS